MQILITGGAGFIGSHLFRGTGTDSEAVEALSDFKRFPPPLDVEKHRRA